MCLWSLKSGKMLVVESCSGKMWKDSTGWLYCKLCERQVPGEVLYPLVRGSTCVFSCRVGIFFRVKLLLLLLRDHSYGALCEVLMSVDFDVRASALLC